MTRLLASPALVAFMLTGSAFAQTTTPAAPTPAAAEPATTAPVTDKKAKSKECSMEADKQGLHGKARKTFRSKCKSGKA